MASSTQKYLAGSTRRCGRKTARLVLFLLSLFRRSYLRIPKIYIKDVRSSNGTFINGERLSSEGQESEPFELKSDDIVVCINTFNSFFLF